MINVPDFIKALNCTWIRRLLKGGQSPWLKVFEKTVANPCKFFTMGIGWLQNILSHQTNIFWKSLLISLIHLLQNVTPETNNDIMSSVLWCNTDSNDNDLYLAEWDKLGIIRFVGDIVDEKGRLLKFDELKEQYSIPEISVYGYYRLRAQVKNYIKENRKDDNFDKTCLKYPFHVKILSKNQKGARDMYHVFIKSENEDKILTVKF